MATWIKFKDQDAPDFPTILNLEEAIGFAQWGNGDIDVHFHGQHFRISKKKDPQVYQQILDYIKTTTGHTFP